MTPSERWITEALHASKGPGIVLGVEVSMAAAAQRIEVERRQGRRLTYTHLLLHAVAQTLGARSDLHLMVQPGGVMHPKRVDLGLSVAGDDVLAPVLVIRDAARYEACDFIDVVKAGAQQALADSRVTRQRLDSWGGCIPGFLRRRFIRHWMNSISARRQAVGTFQVSTLPSVDWFIPCLFSASGIIALGAVRDQPRVRNGQLVAEPVARLVLAADHAAYDGRRAGQLITAVQQRLEETPIASNIDPAAAAPGAPSG